MLGLIGKKMGMTQIFNEKGDVVPVTAIKIDPNLVVGEREEKRHGYNAVLLGAFAAKKKQLTKPVLGQFGPDLAPTQVLCEIRDFEREYKRGDELGVELFDGIRFVDVRGRTKGKGFQGVMKRHGFKGGSKTHGSKFHRAGGSTGMAAWPSRVFKGTKMPGRMGGARNTVQNLRLVSIDQENGLLLIKGSIPGPRNGVVIVTQAKKR